MSKEADRDIVKVMVKESYDSFISKVRELYQGEDSPITLRDGQWWVKDRKTFWDEAAKHVYDDHLVAFQQAVITVLGERDPSFEIERDQRWFLTGGVDGKELSYSHRLRESMAETLALMSVFPEALQNCTKGKPETVVVNVMRETLLKADWVLWGSLNSLLPMLAEANPELFLQAVDIGLRQESSPFLKLFQQEGDGFTGRNYMTGLLYALEMLAWQEKYLVRVCVVLGALAQMDPGGKWANRPANSLITILLPWLPQTMASVEKRKVAVKTLFNEYPGVASRLAFNLLPNQIQTSSPTRKPLWRERVSDDFEREVSREEYFEQVSNYAEMLIDWAGYQPKYLNALAEQLNNLPKPSLERLLGVLSSEEIRDISQEDRLLLWNTLTSFTRHHRRFSDADWALRGTVLDAIDRVSEKFSPIDPRYRYRVLFSGKDFDLYEGNDDFSEQEKRLEEKRTEAVKDIFTLHGIDGIINFLESVEEPRQLGYSFATISSKEVDVSILPSLLNDEERKKSQFSAAYVFRRHQLLGWDWAAGVVKKDWSKESLVAFLTSLPFTKETWTYVEKWLGEQKELYWRTARVDAYQVNEEFEEATRNLLDNGRATAAVNFIYIAHFRQKHINPDLIYRALMEAGRSVNSVDATNAYYVVELIGKLQNLPDFDEEKLATLEWAYLPLLESHMRASPKLLERKLASDPDLFCKAIQMVFHRDDSKQDGKQPSEEEREKATNVWRLLRNWRIVPGTKDDGSVDGTNFNAWLHQVIDSCKESGHLSSALHAVGFVLIHSPEDESGLWIKREVASALNRDDAEVMRRGYWSAVINSRGAHWVDPTGKPEKELAQQFNQKAEEVENEGFHRFAITLRGIAEFYEKEAERIIDQNKSEGEGI
ncbi:hypothetical protein ACFONN_07115 [Dyella humi]|uniref:Addiction module antitoxin n=1 Tax=Dyella humi TaxID=1770547 RepID=A0ABW8II83_9GAMM